MIAAIDRKEREIDVECAQPLGLPLVHDGVAGVIDARDTVVEHVSEIAVEPSGKLAPEGVRIGHTDPVPGRHGSDRDAVEPDALVRLRTDETLARHTGCGDGVDERTRNDETRAG